jgi:hypothetical protein
MVYLNKEKFIQEKFSVPISNQNLMGNTMLDLVRKYEQVKDRNNWLEALREQDKNQGVHIQSPEATRGGDRDSELG